MTNHKMNKPLQSWPLVKTRQFSFSKWRTGIGWLALAYALTGVLIVLLTSCVRATVQPEPAPGTAVTSDKDGMVIVYVPEGTFIMGSTPDDFMVDADELPQHQVYLDAFWIDQTEVTNAMFATFLNVTGIQKREEKNWLNLNVTDPKIGQEGEQWVPKAGYENHPVVNVTWYGAEAYCKWAGRRLPTEAEWEKAARGTDGQLYPWGNDDPTCDLTNYDNWCWVRHTTPVGSYPEGQSPYGALDMSGNVWELVADFYAADYYANSPERNPTGPVTGEAHVVRGGSFIMHEINVRAARRADYLPNSSSSNVGFRCAFSAND
jgi:formylglycine-generating enzyme required for sulfatase activity